MPLRKRTTPQTQPACGGNQHLAPDADFLLSSSQYNTTREEWIARLAITDSLTDLYNRRQFNRLVEAEISKARRYSRPLSVIMFDIDFFKRINDTFGHTIGDIVLKIVARVTKKTLRVSDIPARYGGEEFIILLPETAALKAAVIAERLRRQIELTTAQGEECPAVTASFGVSEYLFEEMNSSPIELAVSRFLENVDRALYASKNAGKNRVTIL